MIQRENQTFKKLQILEILNVVYDFWGKNMGKTLVTLRHGYPIKTSHTVPQRLLVTLR